MCSLACGLALQSRAREPGAISADMRSHPERDAFPIPLLRSPSARERAAESTSHQLICSRNQIAAGGWEQTWGWRRDQGQHSHSSVRTRRVLQPSRPV